MKIEKITYKEKALLIRALILLQEEIGEKCIMTEDLGTWSVNKTFIEVSHMLSNIKKDITETKSIDGDEVFEND